MKNTFVRDQRFSIIESPLCFNPREISTFISNNVLNEEPNYIHLGIPIVDDNQD